MQDAPNIFSGQNVILNAPNIFSGRKRMKAKRYLKVNITLEFDKGDEISDEIIVDCIKGLYINNELHIDYLSEDCNVVYIKEVEA
tara:strand:- start:1553 stop:1807 length:255 start_codon:yes stop_codon:yes gene_type:complete